MDKIEKEINNAIVRNAAYQFTKSDIKRLIELVENEQVKKCDHHFLQDKFENVLNNESVVNAPRVSEQMKWEEL